MFSRITISQILYRQDVIICIADRLPDPILMQTTDVYIGMRRKCSGYILMGNKIDFRNSCLRFFDEAVRIRIRTVDNDASVLITMTSIEAGRIS